MDGSVNCQTHINAECIELLRHHIAFLNTASEVRDNGLCCSVYPLYANIIILFNFLPVKFLQVQNKLYQLYYTESPLQE